MSGISGTSSMSKSCSMKGMNGSSGVKAQDEVQVNAKKQSVTKQDKLPNPILGSKIDAKA